MLSSSLSNIYQESANAAAASEARSIRNKLDERDMRRIKIYVQKNQKQGVTITLDELTDYINDTKKGKYQVNTSTVCRHMHEVGIVYGVGKGDYPDNVNLSRWLAKRRGFCDKFKKADKTNILVADEAFFGLSRRTHQYEARMQIDGHAPFATQRGAPPASRVSVYGALGLSFYTPLVVFESGTCLNANTYNRMISNVIIPSLKKAKTHIILYEDNYSVHKNEEATNQYKDNDIDRRYLPAYSPDISWIEKVWANMAGGIYKGGKKYANKIQLTAALNNEWERLVGDEDYHRRLVVQGEAACKQIIDNQGFRIHWR